MGKLSNFRVEFLQSFIDPRSWRCFMPFSFVAWFVGSDSCDLEMDDGYVWKLLRLGEKTEMFSSLIGPNFIFQLLTSGFKF